MATCPLEAKKRKCEMGISIESKGLVAQAIISTTEKSFIAVHGKDNSLLEEPVKQPKQEVYFQIED
jgi:hypothetical protein